MASDNDFITDDEWDEEVMVEVRKFGLEHAMLAHLHKREGAADLNAVFKDADRIVNYVLGEMNP
ncbi:MAG: hypothetical protein NT015_02545 [Alphaproteobacteria bacterium]|jgi:hypothetical protein|nr:hypothetical protein [Caulobacteraceae bacterium]MBK8545765.1 hypothetical protein [Caulobacteraceae bacterium]MBL8547120.1 hypothetical protein [Hyphomonadaceae bacterium]MBP6690664.1 hypothetical protein [Hyphomonadaceae bacterium]MCX7357019.1 hypothetical protein [Alphaproteobacteria bacterium]